MVAADFSAYWASQREVDRAWLDRAHATMWRNGRLFPQSGPAQRELLLIEILEELRPKDLFYQILHGLRTLTGYDHSSALLVAVLFVAGFLSGMTTPSRENPGRPTTMKGTCRRSSSAPA